MSTRIPSRFLLLYAAPTLVLLALAVWPLMRGAETLTMRDVLTSHYPLKSSQAEALRQGEIPLVDPYRGGGQPLLGNPNALPLYPSNLLYLVGSPLWALNAHFWLHLLLAPLAFFWLGRAWGLSRAAAWAGGVCYVSSGFFLSLLNLYNLVAGAALAPAFIAASLDAWHRDHSTSRARRSLGLAGLLFGLLILAGDPMFALIALALAVTAVAARRADSASWRQRVPASTLVLVCGALLAAPMVVELLRILPLSYRGYWQFSMRAALSQSWDPRSFVEWLLPFFFGRPDFTFWGLRYYGGNPPLLYSLYPGLLSLALIALGGRPRTRAAWWAWGATLGGLFLAAGAWNPVVRLLYQLPGASALRYPVKLWLIVAVGCSLLCAIGFERLLSGGGGRRLLRILGLMTLAYLLLWGLLIWLPPTLGAMLQQLDPSRLNAATLEREIVRWRALGFLSLVTLGLLALLTRLARRRPSVAGALLLATHLLSQGFFLHPLYDGDRSEHYQEAPDTLVALREAGLLANDPTLVHGDFRDIFGKVSIQPLNHFPDARFFWLARQQYRALHPFAGIAHGQRFELNHSPEGLDSFFGISLARAMQQLDDTQRLRLLASAGVDLLILSRELPPSAEALARREVTLPGKVETLHVYRLLQAAAPVQLVGTVRRAPEMNSALRILTAEGFDPQTMAVLPGPGTELSGMPGTVEVVAESTEALELTTSSATPSVLLTQRAYLDIYRATIDGQPAPLVVGNLHRLALEVPDGDHRIKIWADRRPTRIAWLGFLGGIIGLVVVGLTGIGLTGIGLTGIGLTDTRIGTRGRRGLNDG